MYYKKFFSSFLVGTVGSTFAQNLVLAKNEEADIKQSIALSYYNSWEGGVCNILTRICTSLFCCWLHPFKTSYLFYLRSRELDISLPMKIIGTLYPILFSIECWYWYFIVFVFAVRKVASFTLTKVFQLSLWDEYYSLYESLADFCKFESNTPPRKHAESSIVKYFNPKGRKLSEFVSIYRSIFLYWNYEKLEKKIKSLTTKVNLLVSKFDTIIKYEKNKKTLEEIKSIFTNHIQKYDFLSFSDLDEISGLLEKIEVPDEEPDLVIVLGPYDTYGMSNSKVDRVNTLFEKVQIGNIEEFDGEKIKKKDFQSQQSLLKRARETLEKNANISKSEGISARLESMEDLKQLINA